MTVTEAMTGKKKHVTDQSSIRCGSKAWPVASEEVNLFPAFAPVVYFHNLI